MTIFISGWTIPLRQRWSWLRCLKCTAFFSDALSFCLCGLGGRLKSARLGCEWICLWPANGLCSSLNPTDVTGYPWQPEGLELRAWLETNSGWKEGQLPTQKLRSVCLPLKRIQFAPFSFSQAANTTAALRAGKQRGGETLSLWQTIKREEAGRG